MQTAFGFLKSAPTTSTLVFIYLHGRRARHAADRRIALVVERVVWNVVFQRVLPDLLLGPTRERIDLDESEFRVLVDNLRARACRRLVAANRRDPCAQTGEHLLQRLDLSQAATEIRIALPEFFAVPEILLFERSHGAATFETNAVTRLESIAKLVRFGKEQIGIEIEDASRRIDTRDHVDEDATFGAKACGQRNVGTELVQRPLQNDLR